MEEMQQHMLLAQAGRRSFNALRAYALSCRIAESISLSQRYKPSFKVHLPRVCGVGSFAEMEMRSISFKNPMWLVFDASRSAHDLLGDVENGGIQYLLLRGHVCRVRLPSETEQVQLRGEVLPAFQADNVRVLVRARDLRRLRRRKRHVRLPILSPSP